MKRSLAIIALLASGCVSNNPSPTFYNGNYYVAGDADCVRYSPHNSLNKIMCFNAKKQPTGIREPMTANQMQMYQNMQYQQQMQTQAMNAEIAAMNNNLAAQNQATLARVNANTAVMPTPVYQGGGNQVRCISTGFYTNCRQ